jgi:hypothetical protein
MQGAWQFTSRPLGGGEWEYEWRFPADGRPASDASRQLDAPFVLVGKRTSWRAVGQGLREQLAVRDHESTEGGPAGRLLQESDKDQVLAVFDDLCAFRRDQPAFGFTAKSRSELSSRRAGDCKDLSFLLAEWLNGRGVACSLVYRATTFSTLDGIMPCPYVFDHVFVAVPTDTGTWMLDPFAGRKWTIPSWRCGSQVETRGNLLIVPWRSAILLTEN